MTQALIPTATNPTDPPLPCAPGFERISKAADHEMWCVLERDLTVPPLPIDDDNEEGLA